VRTIGQHRDDLAALLAPVVAGLGAEELPLDELAGAGAGAGAPVGFAHRVLAAAVLSPVPLPPFDNSQMDGFAVRAADAGQALRVVAPIPAGVVPEPLESGTAAPIMTGARIPTGADAVFPVEATEPGAFPAALELPRVTVPADLTAGTFVRVTGSDLPTGAELAPAGSPVTPALLGALAAAGVTTVSVRRPLRVLVVSTGSELQGADADAATIGDANGIALRAALAQVGADSRAVRVPDDVASFDRALDAAVGDWADLVLTTGGISAGAYEVVRQAVAPCPSCPSPATRCRRSSRSRCSCARCSLPPSDSCRTGPRRSCRRRPLPAHPSASTRSVAAGCRTGPCTSSVGRVHTCSSTTPPPPTWCTSPWGSTPSRSATP
jgi:molybdopterin molybdotransferase